MILVVLGLGGSPFFTSQEVFTIGGDCSVDLAPMSYLRLRYPDLLVAYIDAHADLNAEWESPSGHFHGIMAEFSGWMINNTFLRVVQ